MMEAPREPARAALAEVVRERVRVAFAKPKAAREAARAALEQLRVVTRRESVLSRSRSPVAAQALPQGTATRPPRARCLASHSESKLFFWHVIPCA